MMPPPSVSSPLPPTAATPALQTAMLPTFSVQPNLIPAPFLVKAKATDHESDHQRC